jgi:hypothetical protein
MKNLLIPILTILLFTGCKKYNEGPAITFRTPEARLTREWNNHRWKENGGEAKNWEPVKVTFKENGEWEQVHPCCITTGTWKFSKSKDSILISLGIPNKGNADITYRIVELTNDKLHYYQVMEAFPTPILIWEYICKPW